MPTKKQLQEENEKLKEENEKLKEQQCEDCGFGNRVWSLLYENDYCPTSYGEAASFIKDILKEDLIIQELKEENEKIGELVISQTDKLKEVSIKYNDGYKINQELKEENEKFEEAMKDALSCSKLIIDFMNKTKGFTEWATPDDCDGDVVDYAIYLEKQIPDKKGKRLSQKDKELLKDFLDFVPAYFPGDGEHCNLLKRLLK